MIKQELTLAKYLREDNKPLLTPYQFIGSDASQGRIALDIFKKNDSQFIALVTYPAYMSGVGTGAMAKSIIRLIKYHYPNLEEDGVDFYTLELPKSRSVAFPILQKIADEDAPLRPMKLNAKGCPFDFSKWRSTYPFMFEGRIIN